MTVEWYDLGQRLRATDTGYAVDRLTHSPVIRAARPVAVRARLTGQHVTVTAAIPSRRPSTATGRDALDLLGSLGVTLTAAVPATLVTDQPATLGLLHRLALTAAPNSDHDAVAAHIAWWRDRADFPAGRAVVDTVAACPLRWVTGAAPDTEKHPATWRRWLDLPDDSTSGLLAIHGCLTTDRPLPWLDLLAEDDVWAFTAAQSEYSDGLDWRRPDSTSRAAIGLRSRCDAADLYAAALLTDPLYRRRAASRSPATAWTCAYGPATTSPGGSAHPALPPRRSRLPSPPPSCARRVWCSPSPGSARSMVPVKANRSRSCRNRPRSTASGRDGAPTAPSTAPAAHG